jgi:hypothetical protein
VAGGSGAPPRGANDAPSRPAEMIPSVRLLGTVLYWVAVVAISVVLVILLILFFESRDQADVGATAPPASMPA